MMKRHLVGAAAIVAGMLNAGQASAEEFPAQLSWYKQVQVGTTLSGTVEQVLVQPGQRVSRGDPMLTLDARTLQATVAAKTALREASQREAAEAERELERSLDLYDRTLLSEHDRLVAENGAIRARSTLLAAEAELVEARIRLEQATIRAPFDGKILKIPAYRGQAITNRCQITPLVEMAGGEISAVAGMTPDQASSFTPGARVVVKAGGKEYSAQVSHREPTAGAAGQQQNGISVHAVFSPPDDVGVIDDDTATMTLDN